MSIFFIRQFLSDFKHITDLNLKEKKVLVTWSCLTFCDPPTPWIVTHQAFLSMEFSRQEYWSGLPFPSPGDLPNPRIKRRSPVLQTDSLLHK